MTENLRLFIAHKAINKSWLCLQLWGKAGRTQTSSFSLKSKNKNGRRFLPHEIERLEEIRLNFINEISNKG